MHIATYQDGDRIVLVLENMTPDERQKVILSVEASNAEKDAMMEVKNLGQARRSQTKDSSVRPSPSPSKQSSAGPAYDKMMKDAIDKGGIWSFVDWCKWYEENSSLLAENIRKNCSTILNEYIVYMRKANWSSMTDDQMKRAVTKLLSLNTAKRLKAYYQSSGCGSLDEFIGLGREVLANAINNAF